jgi:hypothetical protein
MSDTTRYGKHYWCVKSDESKNGEIYVMADTVTVTPTGDLVCVGKDGLPMLALAAGHWRAFFAASLIDGAAVAVEHWLGEVDRGG